MPKSTTAGVSHAGQEGTVARADGNVTELRTPDNAEVESSLGNSSETSPKSTDSESSKSGETGRKPAQTTGNPSVKGQTGDRSARTADGGRSR